MCIKEEFGTHLEFPNENGKFNFVGVEGGTSFKVTGDKNTPAGCRAPSISQSGTPSTSAFGSFSTIASIPWAVNSSQVNVTASSSNSSKPKATVKVLFADMSPNGKPVVNPISPLPTFVPIFKENDSNVPHLLSNVEANLKENNLMLVSNSGHEYIDEIGTRGKNVKI